MRMYDIILKKRNGLALSKEEIQFFIKGYTDGSVADYQMAALLMAVYFNGMNTDETAWLTHAMAKSGDLVDLSDISGIKVDKHSTGGVGDKTTLIVGPIVAACGVPVAKMSGRGLGHTGGTIDKLEAIPGFMTTLDRNKFFEIIQQIGLSVIGQTGNIAPADKKIYALRDVTATVDNISLIASSIMSKKIAAGADAIVLDVKTGSGAFMKSLDEAINLAEVMVSIGEKVNKHTIALITNMNLPLGYAIGNSLEVIEAVATLQGLGPKDLREVSLELAANMLYLAKKGELQACQAMAQAALDNGSAYNKLKEMTKAQGGSVAVLEDTSKFTKAPIVHQVKAIKTGFINAIDTESCGRASVILGAGRNRKEEAIDYSAGIILNKKIGDYVDIGEVIATLHTSNKDSLRQAEDILLEAIMLAPKKPKQQPLIYARVSLDGTKRYI